MAGGEQTPLAKTPEVSNKNNTRPLLSAVPKNRRKLATILRTRRIRFETFARSPLNTFRPRVRQFFFLFKPYSLRSSRGILSARKRLKIPRTLDVYGKPFGIYNSYWRRTRHSGCVRSDETGDLKRYR